MGQSFTYLLRVKDWIKKSFIEREINITEKK